MHTDTFARRLAGFSLLAALTLFTPPHLRAADATNKFGFTGPEIFPIDSAVSLLRSADIDGDGLNDLIVVNNSRSKINILYNQTGKTNLPAKAVSAKREQNELPPDARFRIDSIASEKRISSLVVEDLNGDGRPDIVYYGEPKELVVQYNLGTNGWSTPKRWPIEDGQLTANALTSGDLNGDGLTDLVLLADNQIYVLYQKPDHTLGEPVKLAIAAPVKAIQVLDINGDGRNDLMLVNWDTPSPFRFRLQNDVGQLGPECFFTTSPVRSYWADSLENNKKNQIITIAANSGRAAVSEFRMKDAEDLSAAFKQGQFQVLPLNKTDSGKRGITWGDINGDKLPDLLVAEPESGQVSVFLQKPDGTFNSPVVFSTLTGVTQLAISEDWSTNGKPTLFMLSADERQVGTTQMDENGRLPFPTLIPLEGKPLAMALGHPQGDGSATLAVIVDQDGKRSLVTRTAAGKSKTQKLSESFKSNPSKMVWLDVNQDGLEDLVVLIPFEKIKVLIQVASKDFDEQDVSQPGGSSEDPWMTVADLNGDGKPQLLLAQKNFLRAVVLKQEAPATAGSTNKPGWVFNVKEQINGASSSSRLLAATAVRKPGEKNASVFLLDDDRKALTLCERDKSGAWQVVKNIQLPFTSFGRMQDITLGKDGAPAVAFTGKETVAWMPLQGKVWELADLDGYETPIKDGRLNDVMSGDLDNDGRKDLVFLETGHGYIDLVTFDTNHKLIPANRWPVFEERTFRSRRGDFPEPREAVVADVTGDHKNDLIILIHDRILVYPQQ